MELLAAKEGFDFADPYALGLLFAGVAIFAAVAALSHQEQRAFSASVIYLGLGLAAAGAIELLGVRWLEPQQDSTIIEHAAEFAVIVALFATGLRLDRPLGSRAWMSVWRLLGIVMPLTIAAVAVLGTQVLGLSLGAAVILGAALAPTDPVLAGDVGVGPPGDADEREPNFSLTAEAGLNDGLAFPFVFLGVFIAGSQTGWLGEWVAADVVYGIAVGLALGAAGGGGLAWSLVRLRDRGVLNRALDGWVAIAATLFIYGATEVVGAYGFLAAFAGGLAFRRYERDHEINGRVHDGAEMVEKFCELALILLLGSLITVAGLREVGLTGFVVIAVLLLVVRPAATAAAFAGTGLARRERLFIGWFGVRGIGSLYYVAVALGLGVLSPGEASRIFWIVAAAIVVSIVVHGGSAAPLSRRLLGPGQRPGEGVDLREADPAAVPGEPARA
jgi:sodium/hydrogen antiporter